MRVIFDIPFMRQANPDAYERFNRLATEIEDQSSPEVRAVLREWQTAVPHAGGKLLVSQPMSLVHCQCPDLGNYSQSAAEANQTNLEH